MKPLATPTSLEFAGYDLLVATRKAGEGFDFDWASDWLAPRLRVDSVSVGLNRDFPRAELSIDLSGAREDGVDYEYPLSEGEVYAAVALNTEVVIFAESDGQRRFLFHGYFAVDTLRFSPDSLTATIACTSKLEWVGKQRASWIAGRYMRDRGQTADDKKVALVRALPCIFNVGGRPNRHPDLLTYETIESTPVFTDDDTPDAVYWKAADILKYLYVFYWRKLPEDAGISLAQIVALFADIVESNAAPLNEVPSALFALSDVLKCKADPLACDGMPVVKAMLMWCEAFGCSMHQYTFGSGSTPDTNALFHLNREAGIYGDHALSGDDRTLRPTLATPIPAPRALQLLPPGVHVDVLSPVDAHQYLEVYQGEIVRDGGNVITSCRVLGTPELYEVQVGKGPASRDIMLPLWKPDTMFGDDLSGETMTAKINSTKGVGEENQTGDPGTMTARYTTGGAEHAQYMYVGRLWGLNESRELAGADYAHTNGDTSCWGQSIYDSNYKWASLGTKRVFDTAGQRTTEWIARRRKILPLITRLDQGVQMRPIVECSLDSGGHWYAYPGNYHFLEDRFAVYLSDSNLAEIKNKGIRAVDATVGKSVWEAIIRGTFRLAVRCCVESDEVAQATYESTNAVGKPAHHVDVNVRAAIRYENCTDTNVKDAAIAGATAATLDELTRAMALARMIVDSEQNRRYSGTVVMPRLADHWRPGDALVGIDPRGIRFEATQNGAGWPQIVRVMWVNTPNNQTTHLTIGDDRVEVRAVPKLVKNAARGRMGKRAREVG